MSNSVKVILFLSVLILAGCGPIKPYEVDVQQGNIVDQKLIKELHAGMSKHAVQDLLGTPMLNNTFDDNEWDYVYTNQINGGSIEKHNIELDFVNGKLVRMHRM